jgi:hypothetical protein
MSRPEYIETLPYTCTCNTLKPVKIELSLRPNFVFRIEKCLDYKGLFLVCNKFVLWFTQVFWFIH